MTAFSDPARTYAVLRAETAALLSLDLANLRPADGLRLDLTALLRLSLNNLQGLALSGERVDLAQLRDCFQMLQKLLPAAVAEVTAPREEYSARRKIAALLDNIAAAQEAEVLASLEREEAVQAADALAHVMPSPAMPPRLGGLKEKGPLTPSGPPCTRKNSHPQVRELNPIEIREIGKAE